MNNPDTKKPKKFQFTAQPEDSDDHKKNSCCGCLQQCNYLCVYLTPLKALASEITQKFKQSLEQLGLSVLECTGDEAPPQQLIDEANVLILTPEKYDVITRKINSEQPLYLR